MKTKVLIEHSNVSRNLILYRKTMCKRIFGHCCSEKLVTKNIALEPRRGLPAPVSNPGLRTPQQSARKLAAWRTRNPTQRRGGGVDEISPAQYLAPDIYIYVCMRVYIYIHSLDSRPGFENVYIYIYKHTAHRSRVIRARTNGRTSGRRWRRRRI